MSRGSQTGRPLKAWNTGSALPARGLGYLTGGEGQVCLQGLHGGLAGVFVSALNLSQSPITLPCSRGGEGTVQAGILPSLSGAGATDALCAKYTLHRCLLQQALYKGSNCSCIMLAYRVSSRICGRLGTQWSLCKFSTLGQRARNGRARAHS